MKKVSIFKTLSQINIIDKSLLVFMVILLIQSAYSLFVDLGESINGIDTVIRTTMAGIFGYIISSNFARNTTEFKNTNVVSDKSINTNSNDNTNMKIGFNTENITSVVENLPVQNQQNAPNNAQVIVATFIGLFCLITLIVLRNMRGIGVLDYEQITSAVVISQFRDFVSGSIGFLIGYPIKAEEN